MQKPRQRYKPVGGTLRLTVIDGMVTLHGRASVRRVILILGAAGTLLGSLITFLIQHLRW